jgi:hypothetical protein
VSALKLDLPEDATVAACALAEQAQQLWTEGLRLEAEEAHKAKSRMSGQGSKPGEAEQQQQEEEGVDVTMGFSAAGVVVLFIGLVELGAAQQLPATWVQVGCVDRLPGWGVHRMAGRTCATLTGSVLVMPPAPFLPHKRLPCGCHDGMCPEFDTHGIGHVPRRRCGASR